MSGSRCLVVVADDFGIGPETSRAILELAGDGLITGAVLLVNSPFAAEAVTAWRAAGRPVELGWHPSLTLDPPVLPAGAVPSLVGPDGCLWPLRQFLSRLLAGRLRPAEIAAELAAQYQRFIDLTGAPPALVNAHQHVAVFPPVGVLLERVLGRGPSVYVRRVREPWPALAAVPGARFKRAVLNVYGRHQARRLDQCGFAGNDWLAGITDPPLVFDPSYLTRWLAALSGQVVELACHPGHHDRTLLGRDCATDVWLRRRTEELRRLREPAFLDAVRAAGFRLTVPSAVRPAPWRASDAA